MCGNLAQILDLHVENECCSKGIHVVATRYDSRMLPKPHFTMYFTNAPIHCGTTQDTKHWNPVWDRQVNTTMHGHAASMRFGPLVWQMASSCTGDTLKITSHSTITLLWAHITISHPSPSPMPRLAFREGYIKGIRK